MNKEQIAKLKDAGTKLSNIAFNLSQREGSLLTVHDCARMKESQRAWDVAVSEASAERTTSPVSQAPAEQQESIDTPEFRSLLIAARLYGDDPTHYTEGKDALVAHIDAHTAAAVAKARVEGWEFGYSQSKERIEEVQKENLQLALRAERAEAALAQPVDLSKLTRHGHGPSYIGDECDFGPREDGRYFDAKAVEQLLAALATKGG